MTLNTTTYPYGTWAEKYPDYNVTLKTLPVNASWSEFLEQEYEKEYFKDTEEFLSHCLKHTKGKINIYPYPDLVFNALNTTPLDEVKVVILGQDPYFNNETHNNKAIPQAMGLSFSVPTGMDIPSSLKNIYKNMIANKQLTTPPTHGNLSSWASQGCLLLNTALTVQHGYPDSHKKHWTSFTNSLIKYISDKCENVIFVLWGGSSLSKLGLIDDKKHKILISSHPSGLSYDKPLRTYKSFKESNHFKEINDYLKEKGKTEILWKL